jgi:hypothetical protein
LIGLLSKTVKILSYSKKEMQMKSNFRVLVTITSLTLAALACQAVSGGGGQDVVEIPTIEIPDIEVPTFEVPEIEVPDVSGGDVILSDDFSSAQWGTGTDVDSAVEYVNETLQFIVFTKNWFVWSTPDADDYSDVHMEVTVINNGTDSTTAFGLMCNKATNSDFYYFAVTAAGQYAIAKAVDGQTDLFLTNNDEWADSDLIAVEASSYRVGADCGNGTLTLYVDGQQIDSVVDSSYTSGQVAVLAWSGEEATNTNVSFDDFLMTELP